MTEADQILLVYITCANREEARDIAETLVEEHLAASVNISQHDAIYHWQGVLVNDAEAAMIVKTTRGNFAALETRVRERSSYILPCIIAWPIELGSASYLDYVRQEVRHPRS